MLDHGPIHQGHEKRNPWRQHVHRATRPRSYAIDKVWEAVTSRCLGNGQTIWRRHKHNMLSLLHAACLKLLFFLIRYGFWRFWFPEMLCQWTWCNIQQEMNVLHHHHENPNLISAVSQNFLKRNKYLCCLSDINHK